MTKTSYKIRLQDKTGKSKLKVLKGGDTVETTETLAFGVNHNGINIKLTLSGNKEDIERNFSSYKFDINKKCFIQLDLNSQLSQKVIDDFAEPEPEED